MWSYRPAVATALLLVAAAIDNQQQCSAAVLHDVSRIGATTLQHGSCAVVLVGAIATGKTSIISRLCQVPNPDQVNGTQVAAEYCFNTGQANSLYLVDTPGFGPRAHDRRNTLREAVRAVEIIKDRNVPRIALYFVLNHSAEDGGNVIRDQLKLLRRLYGAVSSSKIRFIVNHHDLAALEESRAHKTERIQEIQTHFNRVFDVEANKILFTCATYDSNVADVRDLIDDLCLNTLERRRLPICARVPNICDYLSNLDSILLPAQLAARASAVQLANELLRADNEIQSHEVDYEEIVARLNRSLNDQDRVKSDLEDAGKDLGRARLALLGRREDVNDVGLNAQIGDEEFNYEKLKDIAEQEYQYEQDRWRAEERALMDLDATEYIAHCDQHDEIFDAFKKRHKVLLASLTRCDEANRRVQDLIQDCQSLDDSKNQLVQSAADQQAVIIDHGEALRLLEHSRLHLQARADVANHESSSIVARMHGSLAEWERDAVLAGPPA